MDQQAVAWTQTIKQNFPGMQVDPEDFLGACALCLRDDKVVTTSVDAEPPLWLCEDCRRSLKMTFTFDWQKREEDFLKWMLINLISGIRDDSELFDKLTKETAKWTNVELTIQINGHDVPVGQFIEGIERNMHYFAEKAAKERLRDMPELIELEDAIASFRHEATNKICDMANKIGIEIDRYND